MSRRGNCWDNSPQKSFFGHLKDEEKDDPCSIQKSSFKLVYSFF